VILEQDAATSAARKAAQPLVTFKADDARYAGLPNYIFGLHDAGGEDHMLDANKPGWVVVSVQVNPPDSTGDFSELAEKGIGVIVRLNHGYGNAGTIPNSTRFDEFALQCARFVAGSRGARIWIIGNEPNTAAERPGNDGTGSSGELITPEVYARCFNRCRKAIRALPGHGGDWVIPAAVAPFITQTNYPNNPSGDWVRYFADVLFQIAVQGGGVDGLALHTCAHGIDASLIKSDAKVGGHFPTRHWNFRAYRDFLAAVLPALRNLPVFITEAQPLEPGWTNQKRDWIQTACAEINAWNSNQANQPVQALCFFRWQGRSGDPRGSAMADKPEVVQDLAAALQNEYRVRWPGIQPKPDYRAEWIGTPGVPENTMTTNDVISGRVVVKNSGAKAWLSRGGYTVRIGYRWFNLQGVEIPVHPDAEHFSLGQNILPGQTAIIDNVSLRAPQWRGVYTVKFDLEQEDGTWFEGLGSPTKDSTITVNAPQYAVEWDRVLVVNNNAMATNTNLVGTVKVKNIGSRTWFKSGENPVHLGYHWYDEQGVEVPVAPYPGNFEMDADTPPGKSATFEGAVLRSPPSEGTHTLRWDLVHEGITWFSAKGAETRDQTVTVAIPLPDLAVKWASVFEIPSSLEPNETTSGAITVQNSGALVWNATGENPVRLSLQWYDPLGNQVLVTPNPADIPLAQDVPPGGTATFENIVVRAPIPQGKYTLAFDLVKEGVTWFSATGSRPYDLPIAVKTNALDHFVQWVETFAIPENTLIVGESIRGRVIVRNAGALVWSSDGENPVQLGYRWYDATGQEAAARTDEFPLRQDVPPREQVVFGDILVQAPDTPGEYTLKWDLKREGLGWFEGEGSPIADLPVTIKPPPLDWGAEFVAHDMPPSLVVGQTTTVDLQLKNIGKNTWPSSGANPVHSGYKWINAAGEPQPDVEDYRTALPHDILPGERVDFAALIAAPLSPGAYRLRWDLVAGGVSWFADGGNPALSLPANVTAAPAPINLWRAEASHNAASAILAIDGDLASFWSSQSGQKQGMWFRVNLGALRLIDGIAFRSPGQGYPFGYTLRISSDGQTWRTVWGVAEGNAHDVVAYFAPYEVLYAQVDLLAPGEEDWLIGDVQVHPTAPWSATASVEDDSAANAIDNNPLTAWTTEHDSQAPNMWFQLDLGRIETVSGLRLVPPIDEIPLGYRVSVWNQQVGAWQKVSERLNNREAIHISFAPVETQYINVQLAQAGEKPWAIREARVTKAMTNWVGPASG
jgi:uncharacterized protein YcfL